MPDSQNLFAGVNGRDDKQRALPPALQLLHLGCETDEQREQVTQDFFILMEGDPSSPSVQLGGLISVLVRGARTNGANVSAVRELQRTPDISNGASNQEVIRVVRDCYSGIEAIRLREERREVPVANRGSSWRRRAWSTGGTLCTAVLLFWAGWITRQATMPQTLDARATVAIATANTRADTAIAAATARTDAVVHQYNALVRNLSTAKRFPSDVEEFGGSIRYENLPGIRRTTINPGSIKPVDARLVGGEIVIDVVSEYTMKPAAPSLPLRPFVNQ